MSPSRWIASLLGLLATALFSAGLAAQTTIAVNAEGWESLWVQRGNSPVWDAVWRNGGNQVVTVMEGSVRGGQVALRRVSSSDGALCEYRGSVTGDGQASGTQVCPGNPNIAWVGQVQGRGAVLPGLTGLFGGNSSVSVNADGWTSVWRQRGNSSTWDAVWTNGNQRVVTVMTGAVRGDQIDLRRTSSSDGALCSYRGAVGPDRRSVSGTQSCPGNPDIAWYGQLGDAGAGPGPGGGSGGAGGGWAGAPQEAGRLYRVENLAFGEAEQGAASSQPREFIVDSARCTAREVGQGAEPGRQQLQVTLCQPNRRMAFSIGGRNGPVAEYDWVFQDGGRSAIGAWRDRSGAGVSIVSPGARRGF